ncbi:MAG: BBP7 family outer membrane beta-barrel protein [Pirellulales bacterium]
MRATWLAIGLAAWIANSASAQSPSRSAYSRGYQPRPHASHGYQVDYQESDAYADDAEAATDDAPPAETVDAPPPGGMTGPVEYGDGYWGDDCCADGCCADGCCPTDCCDPWGGPRCTPCPPTPGCAPCHTGCCDMAVWVNLDFMALWLKGDKLPPIVTTSDPGTPPEGAGVLGLSSTHVLFGDGRVNREFRPGGRVQMGLWFDGEQTLGIDGHYFTVATADQRFYSQSNFASGDPTAQILAIPTINGATGTPTSTLIAYGTSPSSSINGSVSAIATSDLQSAAGGARLQLWGDCYGCNRIYGTGGYRFFRLDEGLTLETSRYELPGTTAISTYDRFRTFNQFQGTYIGTLVQLNAGPLWAWVAPQIAMGNMHQVANISGATGPLYGTPTSGAGILTAASNVGHHWRDHFAYIPEVDVKIGYQITPYLLATLGYNFTYLSSVVRPGTVINPAIGGAQPTFAYNATSLWMQAATAGFQIRF